MSLLDKASLVVTPNAYKESKLYSVVPSDGTGDMTVVRATTATRVNSAGLIEVVPRNLLSNSNDLNQFFTSNSTKTNNVAISPSGLNNASSLMETATTTFDHYINNVGFGSLNNSLTYSVYLKQNGRRYVQLATVSSQGVARPIFDLQEGVYVNNVGTNSTITTAIENVGNGWFRCSVIHPSTTTNLNQVTVILQNSATYQSYLGDITKGVFVYGAQLENFASTTEYFPTTTRVNIPRVDYTNGSCPSLLVEPQRTNLLTYSEALTPNYTFNQCSITSNQISPNGTNNAKRITNGATATDVYFEQSVGITLNSYTWSAFVKKGTDNSATIKPVHVGIGGDVSLMTFTFATETIVTSGAITTSGFTKLTNGWYRIFCTVPITLAVISLRGRFGNSNTANVYNEWYGVQLEVGSYPTSYIPTVASSVTRNADVISKTGISSLIGQTEGTLFCEINLPNPLSNGGKIIVGIGTSPNRIYIAKEGPTTNFFQLATQSASGFNFINSSVITTSKVKFAIAYKGSNNAFYINGSLISSASATANPTSFSNLLIGDTSPETNTDIKINSVQLYKTRLTNTELAQLTTL